MTRRTSISTLALAALLTGSAMAQTPAPKPAAPPKPAVTAAVKDTTKKHMAAAKDTTKMAATSTGKKKHAGKKMGTKPDTTKKKP